MGRLARIVAVGMPHQVTQRGNRGQPTFFCDDDYRAYLSLMVEWCGHYGTRIWAYCLMPDHVHLIVVPQSPDGLARPIGEAHRRYTRQVNARENWRGYLWQGRFSSFAMDEPYLLPAARYVERTPIRAKRVRKAHRWPWSSAAAHAAGRGDAVAEGAWLADQTADWDRTWREYLQARDEPDLVQRLHRAGSTGRPLGDEDFVRGVGALLGRDLIPKKPGRKPKSASRKRVRKRK